MGQQADIVVLGGGIGGSSMACVLAALGWNTVLLDKSRFPRHKTCGEFLSPESRGILTALGLGEAIDSMGYSMMDKVRLHTAKGAALEIPLPSPAMGISRYLLDDHLHQEAVKHGADLRLGASVESVVELGQGQGYRVEYGQGGHKEAVEARAVIGAWGRNPQGRLLDGAAQTGRSPSHRHMASSAARDPSWVGVKTHYRGVEAGTAVELYFFPGGGYLGLAPVEGGKLNAAALLTREAFQEAGATVQGVLDKAASLYPVLRELLSAGEPIPGTRSAVAPVNISRSPAPWAQFALIGDAAMVIPPLCGDGMAIALRSVELCAPLADRYLRGELGLAEWRDRYTYQLTRELKRPLRWGRLMQAALSHRHLAAPLLQAGGFFPPLAKLAFQATRIRG